MNSEPCAGTNCDGHPHSPECRAEHAAACGPVEGVEPEVWALQWPNDHRLNLGAVFDTEAEAKEYALWCSISGVVIVPLSRCPTPQVARPAAQGALSDWLESQDFYEACQAYRHAKDATPGFNAASAFEGLKTAILGAALSTQPGEPSEDARIVELLGALVDMYDERDRPQEYQVYVPGALTTAMDEVRNWLAARAAQGEGGKA